MSMLRIHNLKVKLGEKRYAKIISQSLNVREKEIQKEIERVTKKYAINNAKEGMLCVRFVDQSKAVIKGMKDKINWGGIISPEGDLMLNGYIPYIYGNLFEYADFQDAWQNGFAKGWEIIQKDETLQNVKNIIDLQKLFKEKGFVKKRYE